MNLTCIYRISDGSYKKDRLADKEQCLENFLEVFGEYAKIIIMADNVKDETIELIEELIESFKEGFRYEDDVLGIEMPNIDINIFRTNSDGNGFAANIAMDIGLKADTEFVYFVEDDYLHDYDSYRVLMEGLELADYVTLYDHPDKYLPASQGGNPFIDEDGGEVTKVFVSDTCHWKLTNSTTMTFATSKDVLGNDRKTWTQFTNHKHPNDFQCFLRLREMGRSLISPLPSRSTHCDIPWVAPLVNWKNL